MKKFEMPQIRVKKFSGEKIVTDSSFTSRAMGEISSQTGALYIDNKNYISPEMLFSFEF